METAIIFAIILLAAIAGIRSYVRRLGSGCCGGGGAPEKRIAVSDRHLSHYPFCRYMKIDGMVCANCARKVENALNRIEGVWATVDMDRKSAVIRMKTDYPDEALSTAVQNAGYTVVHIGEKEA